MPLRDHFRPPLTNIASWEELHGAWPATMAYRINELLPPQYRCGLKVHLGNLVEIDVGAYELDNPRGLVNENDPALAWGSLRPHTAARYRRVDASRIRGSRVRRKCLASTRRSSRDRQPTQQRPTACARGIRLEMSCNAPARCLRRHRRSGDDPRGESLRGTGRADRGQTARPCRFVPLRGIVSALAFPRSHPHRSLGTHARGRLSTAHATALDQRYKVRAARTRTHLPGNLQRPADRVNAVEPFAPH